MSESRKEVEKSKSNNTGTEDEKGKKEEVEKSWKELGLVEVLRESCENMGWKTATKIQREVLPWALQGRDVIGLAETGSGKTGAFSIPILQGLLENSSKRRGGVQALVLAPTRELAVQIQECMVALQGSMGASIVAIVGGMDMSPQAIALARNPHVVVATPGRLVDHLTHTKGFHIRHVQYLVLDEADRMLSMDFEQELHEILEQLPQETDTSIVRQTMLFSATMTSQVQKLQRASLKNPVSIQISHSKYATPSTLQQYYVFVPAKYKDVYFTYLINEWVGQSILVFCSTCACVQKLALMLRNLGFPAISLHGQMSQPKRLGALTKFKSGSRDILICTDVASRGLDIPSVDIVLNYDLPSHGKEYIHRVGRTARAGKAGKAISVVTQYDVEIYQRLETLLGEKLPLYPDMADEQVVLLLQERVNEAQRLAHRELKESSSEKRQHGRKNHNKKRNNQDTDNRNTNNSHSNKTRKIRKGWSGRGKQQTHF